MSENVKHVHGAFGQSPVFPLSTPSPANPSGGTTQHPIVCISCVWKGDCLQSAGGPGCIEEGEVFSKLTEAAMHYPPG